MLIKETIRLFLESIGRSEEYEFYLSKFRSEKSSCFSIIIPDYETLSEAADLFRIQLDFLMRLDLYPALLLAGPRRAEMKAALLGGADSERFMVVSPETGYELREERKIVLFDYPGTLSTALQEAIPLISRRLLFVRMRGSLIDDNDQDISLYRVRKNLPALSPRDYHLRSLALEILQNREDLHLAVTSPFQMLKEIFTVRGAGTLMRRGSFINHYRDLDQVDRTALRQLLENSFGRRLIDPDSLFKKVTNFYIEEKCRGAILLEQQPIGVYLSKFTVNADARGAGVAQELWEEVTAEHQSIFWRSRLANPANRWYSALAEGQYKKGEWIVFWRGIAPAQLPDIINYCLERPEDFSSQDSFC